jgi:transcriptional regulator with XRE-family HTH domain
MIPASVWREPEMLRALATRDIATVYRRLSTLGLSQRRLAGLTRQAQSEISEVLGGRRIGQYDVLVRIADGLAIPRGLLGLAYCGDGGLSVVDLPASPPSAPVPVSAPVAPLPRAVMVTTVAVCRRCAAEPTVSAWTSTEVRALRAAMRMSVRAFARYLGVSDRMLSRWESTTEPTRPGPASAQMLDTALLLADGATRRRFAVAVAAMEAATVES